MDHRVQDKLRGCAVGAALGDALGMPLEFGPAQPSNQLVRDLRAGRLPAGSFTDDTEMAIALAESLLAVRPLNGSDLAARFVDWLNRSPSDVGLQTRSTLVRIRSGTDWQKVADEFEHQHPDAAGNGSLMRCWPTAVAWWNSLENLNRDTALQSRLTHPGLECITACTFVNTMIAELVKGQPPRVVFEKLMDETELPDGLRMALEKAPSRRREDLKNSGWVRHTLESAIWGLLTTDSYEEAVIQVANLGNDADTAAAVTGALAGAAYGLAGIPLSWRSQIHGEWPLKSGKIWHEADIILLADRLSQSDQSSG